MEFLPTTPAAVRRDCVSIFCTSITEATPSLRGSELADQLGALMVDPDRLTAHCRHHHTDIVAATLQVLNDRRGYGTLRPEAC